MKKWLKNPGIYTNVLYILTAFYLGYHLIELQVLKSKYIFLVILGIVVVGIALLFLAFAKNIKRIVRAIGSSFAVFLSIVFLIGGCGVSLVNSFIDDITAPEVEYKDISLVALKESKIQVVEDLKAEDKIGYQTICYPKGAEKMFKALKEDKGMENPKHEFGTINEMVKGLYEETVPVIILDEAYRNVIEDEYPSFTNDTRVLYTINYPEEEIKLVQDGDITKDSFVVLISGIDTYGKISDVSRSDVNILAVVNPVQAKILLISIPRDYYVPIVNVEDGKKSEKERMDKLTHTGLFGPKCTMETLKKVFDVPIDYYVRVNFTSVIDIVDAIGGINVKSDYAFDDFRVGMNKCDGHRALSFARERYAFVDGDRQRGKNQMRVIEAIVKKLSNPKWDYDYLQLFKAVGDCIETNIPNKDIKKLIRFQPQCSRMAHT